MTLQPTHGPFLAKRECNHCSREQEKGAHEQTRGLGFKGLSFRGLGFRIQGFRI